MEIQLISGIFNSFIYAAKELLGTIFIISIIVAMSRVLIITGVNEAMVAPLTRFLRTPALAYWGIGVIMLAASLFFWPSPCVALIGAVLGNIAGRFRRAYVFRGHRRRYRHPDRPGSNRCHLGEWRHPDSLSAAPRRGDLRSRPVRAGAALKVSRINPAVTSYYR